MNDTLKTISERYTCRAFDGRLPEKEKLDAIALAAVQSPSGMNRQAWQIVIITDKALITEMDKTVMDDLSKQEDKTTYDRFMQRGGTMFYNAPCMYLILKQPGTDMDCGIVSENIALAATSLGLGNCICGMARLPLEGSRADEFINRIGIPEGWAFGISVLVGYASKTGTPHEPDMSKIRFI